MFQLLDEIIVEPSVFEWIEGSTSFGGQVFEAYPDEKGTDEVVALEAGLAALAGLQPHGLLGFSVPLLIFQRKPHA